MAHTNRLSKLISTALACLIVTGSAAGATTVDQPQASTGITIVNPDADAGMVEVIEWVEDAFTAPLDIPNVTIRVGGSSDQCHGYRGIYRGGASPSILMCQKWHPNERFITSDRLLIAHELAHAWTRAHLSDETRQTFNNLQNVDNWNDQDRRHFNRGIERAADVIAAVIVDAPHALSGEDICGFELLTGNPADNASASPANDDVVIF